ncbi:lipopolysaccharide biosynthesis protein [Solirubrum puertoriconensis]|nr:oligosaccharide flippase family protein [Solirubrum puertoriconensis]
MSSISRSRSAFWGTISSQVFTIITMLVAIISTPLMVRFLDKEAYGLSIIFFQIINYLSLFDFGLSTAVNRSLALHRGDDEYNRGMVNRIVSTGVFTGAFFGLLVTISGSIFAPFVPELFNLRPDLAAPTVPIVITLSLLVGGQLAQRGFAGIFYAHHRQPLVGTPYFIIGNVGTGLTILLLSRGVGLWAFAYVNAFQFLANLLVQVWLLRRYYPDLRVKLSLYDQVLMKSMMSYGIFMFLHGIATQIILFTDRLVIGKVLSLSLVTIFSITVRIPEVGMTLLSSITGNALPAVAEIVVHEGPESAKKHFKRMMILMVSLSMMAFWLMLSLDQWFINLWVGDDFFAGNYILLLALVIMVQQTITRTGSFFLDAKGVVSGSSVVALVEAGLNLAISITLGKIFGMSGILWGTIIAALLTSFWYTPFLLQKHLGIPIQEFVFESLLKPVVGISVLGAAVYWLVNWLHRPALSGWIPFLLVAACAGSLMAAVVWIVYLRHSMGQYVPARLRRYLLLPPISAPIVG